MARTIDEINTAIAERIDASIDEEWLQATIVFEFFGDASQSKGRYLCMKNEYEKSFRTGYKIGLLFEELHQLMTADGNNEWNRATYVLGADDQFTIELESDQMMADEVEQ